MPSGDLNDSSIDGSRASARRLSRESLNPAQVPLPPSFTDSLPQEQQTDHHSQPAHGRKQEEERKPTLVESWGRLLQAVANFDDDTVKNWKEDIDTLLVFAGLFSAVVTAFTIESYQWLVEDPADITVALLTQISMQLNATQTASLARTPFKPDASSIRINCFWFLSLIFSLTSGLFALLCKQWLREHQRDTPTRTPGEALALRQLRRDSFEKWGVSSFLSALPILLEVALLLFFVGVLDLLWNRHVIPFVLCFTAVTLSAGLYFVTTILPTVVVPHNQTSNIRDCAFERLQYQFICPYKSPQAWAIYRLSCKLILRLLPFSPVSKFVEKHARGIWDHLNSPTSDWSSFDLQVVRQFDQDVMLGWSKVLNLKVYELRALEWAVTMFRDSPSMVPHLQNVLGTLPPTLAMSAVLGSWRVTMWKDVSASDVEVRLKESNASSLERQDSVWWKPDPTLPSPLLHHSNGIQLMFCHQFWMTMSRASYLQFYLDDLIASMKQADLQQQTNLRFVIPFPVVDALWTHQDPNVRQQGLRMLRFFEESWKTCPGYSEVRHNQERKAFIGALASHFNRTDRADVSVLLTSDRGLSFVNYIHGDIISRRLRYLGLVLIDAVKRAQEAGNSSSESLISFPEHWWLETVSPSDHYRAESASNGELEIVVRNDTGDEGRLGSFDKDSLVCDSEYSNVCGPDGEGLPERATMSIP